MIRPLPKALGSRWTQLAVVLLTVVMIARFLERDAATGFALCSGLLAFAVVLLIEIIRHLNAIYSMLRLEVTTPPTTQERMDQAVRQELAVLEKI